MTSATFLSHTTFGKQFLYELSCLWGLGSSDNLSESNICGLQPFQQEGVTMRRVYHRALSLCLRQPNPDHHNCNPLRHFQRSGWQAESGRVKEGMFQKLNRTLTMQILWAPRPALSGWATGKSKPTPPSTFQEQINEHTEITRVMKDRGRFLLCNLNMPGFLARANWWGLGGCLTAGSKKGFVNDA